MAQITRFGLIVAVVAVIVAGLGRASSVASRRSGGPLERIVLAAEPVPPSAPVWIAEQNGYFRQEGVEVEIREFESGRTALFTMVEQGGLDMATAAQTPVVAKSFRHDNYAIVAGMMASDQDVKLLARRDRGITAAPDLNGKTIGITSGSSGHFFLSLFLAYHQLQLADVTLRDREATRLGDALIAGEVDAIVTWEPHIYRARKALGERALLLPSRNIYREDFYFVARKDFIGRQPEALRRFLRAIERAQRFIHQHRPETLAILQRRLNVPPEILAATWDEFLFELSLDESILVSLEDEARWAIEHRLTDASRAPNYLDYVHADALRAVKPEAVSIPGTKR